MPIPMVSADDRTARLRECFPNTAVLWGCISPTRSHTYMSDSSYRNRLLRLTVTERQTAPLPAEPAVYHA